MKHFNDAPLTTRNGCSRNQNAAEAVRELHGQISQENTELVMFFCSSHYDLLELQTEINRWFPGNVVGCTTAGELGPEGFTEFSITGMSFAGDIKADSYLIDLANYAADTEQIGRDMAVKPRYDDEQKSFGVLLVDGLSLSEEHLASSLYKHLGEMPIIGGSAGDDLKFDKTHIFANGAFHTGKAVFTAAATHANFTTIKFQHFKPSASILVVTDSDPAVRVVKEINGIPAVEAYASELGVSPTDFNSTLFANNPLILELGGEIYVRSIQTANADGSLTLFCAIETGVVLSIGQALDPIETAKEAFRKVSDRIGTPQLTIGSNCILRRLEFKEKGLTEPMTKIYLMNNVVGFNTYGEQWDAVHVNQTFTGIAIGA